MDNTFFWQDTHVSAAERAALKNQQPQVVWFTGLSGAGKSTLANALERELCARGHHTFLLDGDNIRHGLNSDLDLSAAGRQENIRRIGEVCKLFIEAGLIVITAFVSPYRTDRDRVRQLIDAGSFVEVYVDASLESCTARDPKGLYTQAREGRLSGMTGIDAPYEPPLSPELRLDTDEASIDACIQYLLATMGLSNE